MNSIVLVSFEISYEGEILSKINDPHGDGTFLEKLSIKKK